MVQAVENSLTIPQKVKQSFTADFTPRFVPKRTENKSSNKSLSVNDHSSPSHNNPRMEMTQMSIDG